MGMKPGLVLMLALAAGGCGLSDYQSKMDAQRARIQKFDDVNALLDDPISMPVMKFGESREDKPAWPFDVYLRLPKGFSTTAKDRTPYPNFGFFRYAGADPAINLYVLAVQLAEPDEKQEVGKYHRKSFRFYLRKSIEDYHFALTKLKLTLPEKVDEQTKSYERFTIYPDEVKPIVYKYIEYRDNARGRDPSVYGVYMHEEGNKAVCIVAQYPLRTPNEEFNKSFKASLGTLDIGPEAANRRAQFKKARG